MTIKSFETRLRSLPPANKAAYESLANEVMEFIKSNYMESYSVAKIILENNDGSELYDSVFVSLLPTFYYQLCIWAYEIMSATKDKYLKKWVLSRNIVHNDIYNELFIFNGIDVHIEMLKNQYLEDDKCRTLIVFTLFELSELNKNSTEYSEAKTLLADIISSDKYRKYEVLFKEATEGDSV